MRSDVLNQSHHALLPYAWPNLATLVSISCGRSHPHFSTMQHDAVMIGGETSLSREQNVHEYPLDDVALCGSMGD